MAVLAVLGVVASCLGPAIEIGKLIAAPIRRQCSYLCCFSSNIKTLEAEAKILDNVTSDLQGKIDPATNDARPIYSQVETWLKDSVKVKTETKDIVDGAPNVESGCLELGKRYSLSKKAKKTTIAIKLLVGKCKFTDISHPPPPAATAPVQSGTTTHEFESRGQIEEEIMKSLGDKNANKIGICGMGGLGKTTMARKMMNRALKEGLFGEVVMAVVSQPVDKLNIQLQIAEPLGLTLGGDTLISRANRLRERLSGNKRILLVLDDVWGSIDLVELGILCENGCRVLITSRDNGVLTRMDVEKVFQLKILDEKESWDLFRGNAGTCVDRAALNSIAKDVMRECKGLPLALATVGVALKDENDVSIWEDALGQLRRSNPADIPSIIEQVYKPLKLSYDRLGNPNAKSMILLCCLFPEDFDIPLDYLVYFATGLHLFQDIRELKEVRGRTSALVKTIKNRGLLLDGSDEDHVRMHDVARDVSIFIASKEGRVKGSDCTWISFDLDVPPLEHCFPKLKLLWTNNMVNDYGNLIGGSMDLNVLFIEKHDLLKSLPQLCSTSVATLLLYNCTSLESIAAVGEMKSLEILICHDCRSIKELPEQVRGLKRLKLFEITGCYKMKRVATGVISSMVALEELKIMDSFKNWKGGEIQEEEEGNEASLREIESLVKLRCLDIQVSEPSLAAQPLCLSPKLAQFRVDFGKFDHGFPGMGYERTLFLNYGPHVDDEIRRLRYFSKDKSVDYGTHLVDLSRNVFLARTECLYACGSGTLYQELNIAAAQGIRWLTLKEFRNKKNIISAAAFPLLEYLSLDHLCRLEEIWDDDAPIPYSSLTNLKHLRLDSLWALKRVGKIQYCDYDAANDFSLQLKTIELQHCDKMEHLLELVPNEEEQDNEDRIKTVLVFPKLERLTLGNLRKFTSICSRGIKSIRFPLLTDIEIDHCRNLKWLISRDDGDDHYQDVDADDVSSHLFCRPEVSFGNLQRLRVYGMESKNVWCDKVPTTFFAGLVELHIISYNKIRSLFPSSQTPPNLVNLRILNIRWCEEMVKVIEDNEVPSCDLYPTKQYPLFPSLKELSLSHLPKLESICQWRCDLELPSLEVLDIDACDEITSFNAAAGSLAITPALQSVKINGVKLESVDDLNAALHQLFDQS